MPVDPELAALAGHVGEFHITDRAMKRAQDELAAAIAGGAVDGPTREAYLSAVHRYFDAFHREARARLRDVDKRLENANQVVFNLTAERGVAVKRIEATQRILHEAAGVREAGVR